MTKREEAIEKLTKGIAPKDKKKLIDFWNGKRSISIQFYSKYQDQIEKYNDTILHDKELEEFLNDTKRQYNTPRYFIPGAAGREI